MRGFRRIAALLKNLASELPEVSRSIKLIVVEVSLLVLYLYGLFSLLSRLIPTGGF